MTSLSTNKIFYNQSSRTMSDKATRKNALITGATKGLGLATALQFAQEGYQTIITYAWGSVPDEEVLHQFKKRNLIAPLLVQADVSQPEDTAALLSLVKEKFGTIEVFVSGVAFANVIRDLSDYSEKALLKSIEYSSWPLVAYTKQIKEVLGQYPRYIIGLSSNGPDRFVTNYDFAAVTKALMETMVKYLNYHFYEEEVNFNIVRCRSIVTDNVLSTFGKDWTAFVEKFDTPESCITTEEVAKVVYMLCSGLMDAIRGQTLMVDKGDTFSDNRHRFYAKREALGFNNQSV